MIKKLLICFIVIITLTGCSLSEKKENKPQKEKIYEETEKDYVDPYLDDNPIILGLYQNNNGTRNLITSYTSPLTIYQDIASFEVYYTKEAIITGSQKNLWNQYYQTYQDIDSYKIGYHIKFETTSGTIEKNLLMPSDVESFFDYIQVYLYDDINQNSGWYSHITQAEVTDTTTLTSIKLTASTKIDKVTSPIILTVFTYNSDDFDENNHYRGNSSYQITINRQ